MGIARRTLSFATLDDVAVDAEHLLAGGYEPAGNWDLPQVCGHVAEWMRYGMDGFPRPPVPVRLLMWVARNTMGPKLFRKYLAEGAMPAGKPTMPQTVPAAGGDAAAAVAKLRETVEKAKAFPGPPVPSPFFGPMTRDEWVRLNCVHAAHHLSFLVPTNPPG